LGLLGPPVSVVPGSLYVHIPFCRKACSYCNFHFTTSLRQRDVILRAVVEELNLRILALNWEDQGLGNIRIESKYQGKFPLKTLYMGGGTPSLLTMDELTYVVKGIGNWFDLYGVQEFTLEANPEDVNSTMVKGWRSLGVNRISLGIQSFDDRNLLRMNRAHDAGKAREALRLLQNEGFQSLSADLIYGFPDRTMQDFEDDLHEMLSWGLSHFSSYQLTCEPKTAFYHQVNENKVRMVSEDLVLEQMMHLYNVSASHGYRAYEISNFAFPGHEAVHNSCYWSGYAYWGLGPSAHSYDGFRRRSWNVAHNARYQMEIQSGKLPKTEEVLSDDQKFNEDVLIALRLMDGLNWVALEEKHGSERVQSIHHRIKAMPKEWFEPLNLADRTVPLRLSFAGRAVADFIAVELFADSS